MNKKAIFLYSVLILLSSCTSESILKKNYSLKEIKNINLKGSKNGKEKLITLNSIESKDLVQNLQNSYPVGHCKFKTEYLIEFILKNNSTRTFRLNGQNIKENEDLCYNFKLSNLIHERLKIEFSESNEITSLDRIQGEWIHSLDSLSTIQINGGNWKFKYYNEEITIKDNYSIKIRENINSNLEVLRLTNDYDTLKYEILGVSDSILSISHLESSRKHLYIKKK